MSGGYTLFGTEFEKLDADEIASRKPTAIQDQIATDENGRRRFHGAFSGGFSAGYYNTVGSKEGWKPSEFKSSRDDRVNRATLRPEDLMDDEDLGEFGISTRRIQQSQTFAGGAVRGAQKRPRLAWEHDVSTVSALSEHLETLVKPVKDSIGVRMLRAMGWREGRGVGLATIRQIKSRGGSSKEAEFDRQQAAKYAPGHELAPEDELIQQLKTVEGTSGLGYQGLRHTTVLDEQYGKKSSALKLKEKSKGIRGQAFGVGAFEAEDESVYSNFDMSQYDFAIGGSAQAIEAPDVNQTFEEMPRCQNPRKFYSACRLPPNFKPEHKVISMEAMKLPESLQAAIQGLSIVQRAKLLGEDRIANKDKPETAEKRRAERASSNRRSRWDITDQDIEREEKSKDRIEFPNEPMKQRRFKEFLNYLRRGLPYMQPTDMSVWEWEAEKREFETKLTADERGMLPEVRSRSQPLAKSSLALPIQELLASKFTKETGSSGSVGSKDEDKMSAVKMGFFGDKTRTMYEWYPSSILAKRFNVPHPYPGATMVGVPHLQKTVKTETIINLGLPNTANEVYSKRREEFTKNLDEVVALEKPKEEEDVFLKEEERPPASIFDAIFGESDPEDDEDEEEEEEEKKKDEKDKDEATTSKVVEESSTEPPKKVMTVMDIEDEYGPVPPPSSENQGLTGFSVLRYLQEELANKKKKKKSSHHKSKKSKKEKKSKKSKKEKKSKKHKHDKKSSKRKSSSESSSDSWSSSSDVVALD